MKTKIIPIYFIYYIILLYLELIFRIFCINKFFSLSIINILLYLIPISIFMSIISKILSNKKNYYISLALISLLTLYFCIELVFERTFNVFFSLSTLGLANQTLSFLGETISSIMTNIIPIFLLFIPLILTIIFHKKIDYFKCNKKELLIYIISIIISILLFLGSLFINKEIYDLYFNSNNLTLYKEKMGVISSLGFEIKSKILKKDEEIEFIPNIEVPSDKEPEPEVITYNNLDIDFNYLISNESNSTLKSIHEYFSQEEGTKKNKYTNYYQGKNLILIVAESFNSIAVDKNLTPTLYKLVNNGFTFDNFYSPVILSTIGGEYQVLTGLYPNISLLSSIWRKKENNYLFGIANRFKDLGYNTYAYHNNQYNFQNRDNYLKSLGFTNYQGCYNGLETKINCRIWPQSDQELIEATFDDYKSSTKPFMTYYVTVSGHMGYNWGNAMSKKHYDKVKDLPYSEDIKAYLATQIELDLALETLINKLTENNIIDDTVIALVGDHYPYAISLDHINEVSNYERDEIFEINRSNFILWNNKEKNVKIEKVGSQIDVLPTLYNLFGVSYDSRLIIGKDILSDTSGLAIFANQSWISDYGRYNASKNEFIKTTDDNIPENYVNTMNQIVSNKIKMSKLLLEYNYYNKVLESSD